MRTRIVPLIATILVGLAVIADSGTNSAARVEDDFPIIGMTPAELTRFLDAVKEQLPQTQKVISLSIKNGNKVVVRTGQMQGPLSGGGEQMTFEFKNETNRWRITDRHHWIS